MEPRNLAAGEQDRRIRRLAMNHLRCSFALLAVLVSGTVVTVPAAAQGTGAKPAAPAPMDPKVAELVQRAREVMHGVQSMTYNAEVIGNMPDGNRQSIAKTAVVVERGEIDGQWKLLVEGDFYIESKASGKRENEMRVQAGYDGDEVGVVDTRRRIVRLQNTKEPEVVRVTMNQGSAATSVAWELLGEKALNGCDVAIKAELESPQPVDGLECDVVWFVPPKAKSVGGTVHESAIVPSKIYFAKRDGMPRRFEIYRPAAANAAADSRGEPTRQLTLTGLVVSSQLSGKNFSIEIPEGYNVTDADGKRRARKPKSDTPADAKPADKAPAAPATPTPSSTPSTPTTYKWPLLPSTDDAMRVGTQAPAFDLKDFDGKSVKMSDFKGQVLVLDFWGTWCPPCRASMPAVQKVYEKYKDKGVVVLGMNSESNPSADPKKFKLDNKITYPSVTKAETVSGLFKVQSWPTFYVFGKDGKLVWASNGLRQPPGGGGGNAAMLEYLESNLSQAIDKALEAK